MAERQESILESVIRGRHIYKQIWRPLVGKILTFEHEEGNNHDKFTVSLLTEHATVPREFSRVFWHFLRHRETITCVKLPIEESVVKLLPLSTCA